ncbi:MAG TPA: hypothetical protein VG733_04000 [Chthoniobacteraceae bacterium]|nr:hypothetical protein [Chthoniobacteraceae bacterium]
MNIRRKRKGSLFSRILPWAFLALAVIFVGGFIGLRMWFYSYLRSPAFHDLIGGLTSKQIKADGGYESFSFSDGAIYSNGYEARGNAGAAFTNLNADQLRAQINLGGIWQHAWQIDEIDIQRLDVALGHPAGGGNLPLAPAVADEDTHTAPPSPWAGFLPNRVDLRKVLIHETNLKWGDGTPQLGAINNAELTITPDNDAWKISCDSGTIAQQGQPKLTIMAANLRYQRPTLFITDADLRYNADSSIQLSGQVDFNSSFDVQARLNGIPVGPLLRPDWRQKLKGNLSGSVEVSSALPMAGSPRAEGDLSLSQGELEALPILDEIATFTNTERFRKISLSRVNAHFKRTDAVLEVTKFVAESEGLIRVDGSFTVLNGMINGNFQVGVTPASLEWLTPDRRNSVFTVSHDGYVWTPVHLTGPVDRPSEDLSPRLITAAAGSLIDTGTSIINQVPGAGTVTNEGKTIINSVLSPLFGN